jgi:peptidyl-prolyl cis-trans isomerase C
MRPVLLAPALLAALSVAASTAVLAQPTPVGGPAAAAGPDAGPPAGAAPKDPLVARVNGVDIHMSDVVAVARTVPNAQTMQPQQLYPMVLERLVSMQAVADVARKQGLEKDPAVQHQIVLSTDEVLSNAYIGRTVGPTITQAAIEAAYKQDYANKPGQEEVHAAHILVASEAEAKKIIAELKGGADFAKEAAKYSTEPGAGDRGGDLGWFGRNDMVPEFATAAFAMKPGQISETPVHTQFGWHVIKVEGTRVAPPPPLDQVQGDIREKLIQDGVQKEVAQAVAQAKIERFKADGTVAGPMDNAQPPPAPAEK